MDGPAITGHGTTQQRCPVEGEIFAHGHGRLFVGLLALGFADSTVFLLSAGVMGVAWLLFGLVHALAPVASEKAVQQKLCSRWPFRIRIPRI